MKIIKLLITVVIASFITTGCGEKDKDKVSTAVGIWQTIGYGYIIDVTPTSYTLFNYTEDYCLVFDKSKNSQEYESFIDQVEVSGSRIKFKSTNIDAEKLKELPSKCDTDLTVIKGDENYVFKPEEEFEIFWQTFNEHYAFFNIENVDWNEIHQIADTQINALTTEEDFFEVAANMVAPLKDFHVNVVNPYNGLDFSTQRKKIYTDVIIEEYISDNGLTPPLSDIELQGLQAYYNIEVYKGYLSTLSFLKNQSLLGQNDNENIKWGITTDNIGYLMFESMDLEELVHEANTVEENMTSLNKTLLKVFTALQGTDGLIIDIRMNGGGNDETSLAIMSHIIDQELFAFTKQAKHQSGKTTPIKVIVKPQEKNTYIKPIVLLTSTATSSAAEILALAMLARPDSVLIGESTGGGLSDALTKILPHGLVFTLSNEYYYAPNGDLFEGVGVPVEIEAAFMTKSQRELGFDEGVNLALQWFTGTSIN